MRVLGLCGGIGAGKSTVARIMHDAGADVIDVDALGRQVLEPTGGAFADVVAHFGEGILADDGTIDRAALGAIVFGDPSQLEALEAISHPAINRELDSQLSKLAAAGADLVVLDMAVLVESSLGQDLPSGLGYDTVVVVAATEDVRLRRLQETRGMSVEDARARMAAQATDAERAAVADVVIDNSGTEAELTSAVASFLTYLG